MRSSRAWFEWVRQCAIDAERSRDHLMELEAAEEPHSHGFSAMGRGGNRDPMGATDRRMAYEDRLAKIGDAWYKALDRAQELLYGEGGVSDSLGPAKAMVVDGYYCSAMTWPEAADHVGYSVRWCQAMAASCFRWLDEHGEDAAGQRAQTSGK